MRNPQNREAISPVIATIIIVAVAIAIALAAAAWLMGIWGVFVGGPRVSASLVAIYNTTTTEKTVIAVLSNTGTVSDDIMGATISNATWSSSLTFNTTTIPAGEEVVVGFTATEKPTVGREYTVEIALKSGERITLVGVCKKTKT